MPSLLLQPLIENAIKYAVTPAKTAPTSGSPRAREGQAVRIEVADNGNGEGARYCGQPVDRRRTGEHSGPTVAGLWRERIVSRPEQNDKGGFSVIVEIPYETGDKA